MTPDTTLSNSVRLDSPKKLDRMVVGGGRCDIWVWLSSEENCLKHTNDSSDSSEMMEIMKIGTRGRFIFIYDGRSWSIPGVSILLLMTLL